MLPEENGFFLPSSIRRSQSRGSSINRKTADSSAVAATDE